METPKYELVIEAKDMGGHDVGLTGTATDGEHRREGAATTFKATW